MELHQVSPSFTNIPDRLDFTIPGVSQNLGFVENGKSRYFSIGLRAGQLLVEDALGFDIEARLENPHFALRTLIERRTRGFRY